MKLDRIVRGGLLVTSKGRQIGDVGILDGKIAAIGDLSNEEASETIDATGLAVIPGAIDTQVHFREPGMEHKEDLESGTRAALMGGVTCILEMPNTNPTTTTPEALQDKLKRAEGRAWCHYGFFFGASTANVSELDQFEKLPGTPGIKIFVGSSTGPLLVDSDQDLLTAFQKGDRRIAVHSEDESRNVSRKSLISENPHAREHPYLRDSESARISTERLIEFSRQTGRGLHILHISTLEEPPMIAAAKAEGLPVTAEVTPQHLWFSAEDYERLGTLLQMNPPIRSAAHREALWKALNEGVFDVFGSDHAPHTLEEKAKPYPQSPSGMPGVQTMLPVLLTFVHQGRISLEKVVQMVCERPAELYGMVGKGHLEVGYDADLVLVNLEETRTVTRDMVESKSGWSPYEGEQLTGWPEKILLNGELVVENGVRLGSPSGRMIVFEP